MRPGRAASEVRVFSADVDQVLAAGNVAARVFAANPVLVRYGVLLLLPRVFVGRLVPWYRNWRVAFAGSPNAMDPSPVSYAVAEPVALIVALLIVFESGMLLVSNAT
jgi:hypothetical protein